MSDTIWDDFATVDEEAASSASRDTARDEAARTLSNDADAYCAVLKDLGEASLRVVHDYDKAWRSGVPEEAIASTYAMMIEVTDCYIEHLRLMAAGMSAYVKLSGGC